MAYPSGYLLFQELQKNPIEWLYLIAGIAAILLLTIWLDHKEKKKPLTCVRMDKPALHICKADNKSTPPLKEMHDTACQCFEKTRDASRVKREG